MSSNQEMAELLAQQYDSVFEDARKGDNTKVVLDENVDIPILKDIVITNEKLTKALSMMTSKPSPGPDGIPAPSLKHGGQLVEDALVEILGSSMENGLVDQLLRDSLVDPRWKGGDKSLCVNYRPISLTSHYSKLMENIIRMEMVSFMDEHGLMDDMQHGSRKGRSTVSQLLAQHDAALRMIEDGGVADIIYLDFSKAFDRVCHPILLSKLSRMGIRGNLLRWIKAWLQGRRQAVRVGQSLSKWLDVPTSVPQGSIIGPLLFLIFISDLGSNFGPSSRSRTQVRKYMDDTKAMRGNSSPEDVEIFQEDLNSMYPWEKDNRMPFNGGKFMHLRMSTDSTRTL